MRDLPMRSIPVVRFSVLESMVVIPILVCVLVVSLEDFRLHYHIPPDRRLRIGDGFEVMAGQVGSGNETTMVGSSMRVDRSNIGIGPSVNLIGFGGLVGSGDFLIILVVLMVLGI